MSLKRHVCRFGRNVRTPLEHIWIGDDVLDEAIIRFGGLASAKRGVGYAPGPLEARKRAAKRRLAHLSQAGAGAPGYLEPSLFIGVNDRAREGRWQWQAPAASVAEQPDPVSLPAWLTELIHHPTASPTTPMQKKKPAMDFQVLEKRQELGSRLQEHAFIRRLEECDTLHQLRALADFYDVDVRKHSQKAFRHLYERQMSLRTCLEFLEDANLDDPNARNLAYLLGELRQQLKEQADAAPDGIIQVIRIILVPWIKTQISLGRRQEGDITDLAMFFSDLAQAKYLSLRQDIGIAILEGLRSSTVLGLREVTLETRKHLLQSIMKGEMSLELQNLGLDIVEALPQALSLRLTPLVSRFLAKCFSSRAASHGLEAVRTWQQKVFPKIGGTLQGLPQDIRSHLVRSTSRHLVLWQSSLPGDAKFCAGLLDQWWSTIVKPITPGFLDRGLGSLQVEGLMPSDRPDTLASYANHLGDRKKARFVLRNWFAGRMVTGDLEELFKRLTRNFESSSEDSPFLCLLRTVRANNLRSDDTAWYDFVEHVFRLLGRLRMYQIMVEIFTKSKDISLPIPPDVAHNTMQLLLEFSPQQAHQIFRLDTRLNLEDYPALAKKLIEHSRVHPNTVWHCQQRHHLGTEVMATETFPKATQEARVHLLNTMAIAFSEARHITSRMARRHVMKCLHSYRREGLGPLSPQISRAIIQAGIIRPLREDKHVNTDLLTYILGIVREIEGADRADEIDHIVYSWRQQVKHRNMPMRELERRIFLKDGPLDFKFSTEWSKSHRRYDRVMLPIREA